MLSCHHNNTNNKLNIKFTTNKVMTMALQHDNQQACCCASTHSLSLPLSTATAVIFISCRLLRGDRFFACGKIDEVSLTCGSIDSRCSAGRRADVRTDAQTIVFVTSRNQLLNSTWDSRLGTQQFRYRDITKTFSKTADIVTSRKHY